MEAGDSLDPCVVKGLELLNSARIFIWRAFIAMKNTGDFKKEVKGLGRL